MDGGNAFALIEEFCTSMRFEKNASLHSIRAYRSDLLDFCEWLADENFDIMQLTRKQMRRYLAHMKERNLGQTTVNRHLSAIRSFYRWAVVYSKCTHNPAAEVVAGKSGKYLPRIMRQDEVEALLSVYVPKSSEGDRSQRKPEDLRNQAILEFMYASGCRISEVANLCKKNIDFADGSAKVFGKGSKERLVMLYATAVDVMRDYAQNAREELLKRGKGSPPEEFFISNTGRAMNPDVIRRIFKQAVQAAGLPNDISPHTMRHSFASDILTGGADLRTVQELLGHANLSTTQIYTHLDTAHILEAHRNSHPRSV